MLADPPIKIHNLGHSIAWRPERHTQLSESSVCEPPQIISTHHRHHLGKVKCVGYHDGCVTYTENVLIESQAYTALNPNMLVIMARTSDTHTD